MPTNKRRKPKSSASINFPGGAKVQPKGFKDLEIDQNVIITIKGKIKSLSANEYEDGDSWKDLSVRLSSCSIGTSGPQGSISYKSDED